MKFGLAAWTVTDDEYRASLSALNTFFGAVLGFVLTDIETHGAGEFAQLLILSAAIVVGILYVSASASRWWYVGLNAFFIWSLPSILPKGSGDPTRLQVTLAVWMAMTVFTEALRAFTRWREDRAA